MVKDIFTQATIASDSFAIDLQGTFRTASFGGERLDYSADLTNQSPAIAASVDFGPLNN